MTNVGCESDEIFHRKENGFDLQNTLPEKIEKNEKRQQLKITFKNKS